MAQTEGFTVLKENTLIANFQPHFHLRGKAMQVEAILPDGSTQIISYVGNFNFNWMTNYIYADDAAPLFPKGTVIHVTAWYDNTKANKNNPDPDQWVGYGDRTVDEMAHAWMNVVYLTDAEYKALQAERKAKTGEDDERRREAAVNRRRDMCAAGARSAMRRRRSCVGAATHAGAAQGVRRQRHRRVRRLVRQPGRQPQLSRRLLQPQLAAGARHPDRSEQPDRARRSRHGAADAFSARPAVRACSSCPVPKEFKPTDSYTWTIVANGQTHEHSAAAEPRLRDEPVHARSPSATRRRSFEFEQNGTAHPGSDARRSPTRRRGPRRCRRRCR